jgi:hypothetical protein
MITLYLRSIFMCKKLCFLTFSTLFGLIFSMPQTIASPEAVLESPAPKKTLGIQLKRISDDTLEAVLATGNDTLLKLSMTLKNLSPFDKGQVEVPARLFLTDFTSSPTSHSPIAIRAKVECDPTPPTLVLPPKPQSFDSYDQFVEWLKQGHLTNELRITYDFTVNPQSVASSLISHLYFVSESYHFIGTHILPNAKILPDTAIPKASYLSQRGSTNKSTVTLSGTVYLDKTPYPIADHQQFFTHQMIGKKVLKHDRTKKFYCREWLSQGEQTVKATYQEFPTPHSEEWPEVPSSTYSVIQRRLVDKQNIGQLSCVDGSTGEEIDISDGRAFLFECKGEEDGSYLEDIVKDKYDGLYIVKYQNLSLEEEKKKREDREEEERRIYQEKKKFIEQEIQEKWQPYKEKNEEIRNIEANLARAQEECKKCDCGHYQKHLGIHCDYCISKYNRNPAYARGRELTSLKKVKEEEALKLKSALVVSMKNFYQLTGEHSPYWKEHGEK